MNHIWGVFKRSIVVLSICFVLGTSLFVVQTNFSEPAVAASCKCSPCTAPWAGVVLALSQILATDILPQITSATASISAAWEAALLLFHAEVSLKIAEVVYNWESWWNTFFYYDLRPTFTEFTKQIVTSYSDKTRGKGSSDDSVEQVMTQQETQLHDLDSHREARPHENSCAAMTVSSGFTQGAIFRQAINRAWPREQAVEGVNTVGTPGEYGTAGFQENEWNKFSTTYCDPTENAGVNPCATGPVPPLPGADTKVTEVIFAPDTIDVRDPTTKQIVDDLVKNLVEPMVADPVKPAALESIVGQSALLSQRAVSAKRRAAYEAIYHIIARRVPSTGQEDYQNVIRAQAGVDPVDIGLTDNPSYDELMNVMIRERFRTGRYQSSLIDDPENVNQEHVVLEAYKLAQLNDHLELLDRVAVLLASQLANRVQATSAAGSQDPGKTN